MINNILLTNVYKKLFRSNFNFNFFSIINEIKSRRLPTSDPENICEQRLLDWYNSMKTKLGNDTIRFSSTPIISSNVNKC
jgi:hypothetical protein